MLDNDFNLKKYEELCLFLKKLNYEFLTFEQFYINQENLADKRIVVMRHDVDRRPTNALMMARCEKALSVKSTYYIRHIKSVFEESIIKEITNLGHEIGYHYETLSKAQGNFDKAIQLFQQELDDFNRIVKVRTICMHGSPLSKYDNRDLWKTYNYKDFDIIAEPYLSVDYNKVKYFTDTSRTWGKTALNFRDNVKSSLKSADNEGNLTNTQSLCDFIERNKNRKEFQHLIIQTHPERWSYSPSSHLLSLALDYAANSIKYGIHLIWKT